ncbi:g7156 [Coccomyxa elongata]
MANAALHLGVLGTPVNLCSSKCSSWREFVNTRKPYTSRLHVAQNARQPIRVKAEQGPLGSNTLGEVPEDKYEFDEGAAQVQRLLQRDRKELTGIEEIGAGFKTEFDEGESSEKEEAVTSTSGSSNGSAPTAGATSAISFGKSAAASPFGTSKSKSAPPKPFTGAGNAKLFNEMDNLSPYMEPDAMIDQPWWKSITLGQVLIVLSFTLIISLMIGTFAVVFKAGGIHFNE